MDNIVILWKSTEGEVIDTWYDRKTFREFQEKYNATDKALAKIILDIINKDSEFKCSEILHVREVAF